MNSKDRTTRFKGFDKWIQFQVVRITYFSFQILPLKLVFSIGGLLGGIAFHCFKNRRLQVYENIQHLKIWAQEKGIQNLILAEDTQVLTKTLFVRNMANFLSSICLLNKGKKQLNNAIEIENLELFEKTYAGNKGVIVLFPHMGPWELITQFPNIFSSIIEPGQMGSLYRPLNNYYTNRWYLRQRQRNGMKLYSRDDGFLSMIRFLKKQSVLFVPFDQRLREGVAVPLFGKPAQTPNLSTLFYRKTQAPVLSFSIIQCGHAQWKMKFFQLPISDMNVEDGSLFLERSNELLEQIILESPCDYFFFQNRYK